MRSKSARFVPIVKSARLAIANKNGEDLGQVQTFVVDVRERLIAFALVSFGVFKGISDKWFALPWVSLEWNPGLEKLILDMPEEVVKNAPGMNKDKWFEEIDRWRDRGELKTIDRYYTYYGFSSYLNIVKQMIEKKGGVKLQLNLELTRTPPVSF